MSAEEPFEEQFSDIDRVPLNVIEHMSGYWKLVAERKKRQHDVSIKRIVLGQIITIVVVGLSALLIEDRQGFLLIGSTLLLYPALTDLLLSSGAVLSANVHHELDIQDESPYRFGLFAILRSIFSTTVAGLVVGSVAGAIGLFVLDIAFLETIKLALLATSISAAFGLPLVLFMTFIIRKARANPDDIIPALQSSVFNVLMLFSIAISARILA
ncbi:MAG: hypothetical protein U5L95_01285 [Candidatus Saccharibacteria bacterium]|nr:hypothetical protein [Candidatus Saccharibacteria bacterium]